jgi:hypothetical protein
MLYVIVPYRATNQPERALQLRLFLHVMPPHLPEARFVVAEQVDTLKFNRGLLFNACVRELSLGPDDTVCLHDVDLIPEGDLVDEYTRALPPNTARHIGNAAIEGLQRYSTLNRQRHCFGGISLMHASDFSRVNGFPNDFWGWGGEDGVLGMRVSRKGLTVERSCGVVRDLERIQSHHDKMLQLRETRAMGKGVQAKRRRYKNGALFVNGVDTAEYCVCASERGSPVWRLKMDLSRGCDQQRGQGSGA